MRTQAKGTKSLYLDSFVHEHARIRQICPS